MTQTSSSPPAPGPSASEPWCATLYEAHPSAVLVVDSNGRVLRANRAAHWLAGGGSVPTVFDLVDADSGAAFRSALRANRSWSGPMNVKSADGIRLLTECHLLVPAQPTGAAGELVCILERSHPADRTSALLSSLSHELRGPLAPISNAASVLRTLETDNPTLVRLREILERQVARMRRVLDDLADVTRALQVEISSVRKPVAFHDVLQGAIAQNQRTMETLGHRLQIEAPGPAVVIEGDSARLVQMLSSILGNAFKFTPEPSLVRIDVQTIEGKLSVTVADTGRGIAPAFLPRVFDLFAQQERGPRSGLGVGLTLARRIAQFHGGEIVARSGGVGQGSQFVVTFPLSTASCDSERKAASAPASAA